MRMYLSMGSNEGDRAGNLRAAWNALDRLDGVHVVRVSRVYETEPVGVVEQPLFLNVAAEIETDLGPLELLKAVKGIERRLGRVPSERWGPRLIDIDIILCGECQMDSQELTLPHKEFRRRAFVLAPLAEIAPDARDPVTGTTVRELAASPEAAGTVRQLDRLDH